MLFNEFLKEHRKVQEQQQQIDSLQADLKEQQRRLELQLGFEASATTA
jgi:hypothetical protein